MAGLGHKHARALLYSEKEQEFFFFFYPTKQWLQLFKRPEMSPKIRIMKLPL